MAVTMTGLQMDAAIQDLVKQLEILSNATVENCSVTDTVIILTNLTLLRVKANDMKNTYEILYEQQKEIRDKTIAAYQMNNR